MMQTPARVVQGAPITVTYQAVDADGEPSSTTDPGTVTVSITRADGTSIVTGAATTGTGSTRSYTISAAYTGTLDRLAVTWSAGGSVIGTTTVDVVGGVFITVAEIRTLEDSLSDPGQYLPDTLIRARRQIESLITRACGDVVAFVPTFAVTSNALVDRTGALRVPHYRLRAVRWVSYVSGGSTTTVNLAAGVDVASDGSARLHSAAYWPWLAACQPTVTAGYEHGFDAPEPDLKRAVARAIRSAVTPSGVDSRAISYSSPSGEVQRFPTPGLGPWVTGIPEVDEVLQSYASRFPVAGVA
jgi:hypothetical protein